MSLNKDYKTLSQIEETVWRSTRRNNGGDELVVAYGLWNKKPGYFMAWEVESDRPETVCWNGKVSWYPRMFWEDKDKKDSILVQDENELLKQPVPGQKYYWHKKSDLLEKDGILYVPLVQFTKSKKDTQIYKPQVQNDTPDALSSAINYVQWFNENHRQLTKFGKLLSKKKKARTRRKKGMEKSIASKRTAVDKLNYLST